MVRPGALRLPRNYPRPVFVFMVILLNFIRPVQTAGDVAGIPGSVRCNGGRAKTPLGDRFVLPMRASL